MPIFEIASLLVLGALAWLWFDSIRARDAAIAAARRACDAEGLQLLDETVAISGLKPARDGDGRLILRRVYAFEYSDTGDNRHPGSVVMLGREVLFLNVGLAAVPESRTIH
jgi:hypothetical protein